MPFTIGAGSSVATTATYAGYGDWDGATGLLHLPDLTITDNVEGSGVGRLLLVNDASGAWRVKVHATLDCPGMPSDGGASCASPGPPTELEVTPGQTSLDLSFASARDGAAAVRYDVRYREGAPIDEASFLSAIPPSTPPPVPGAPGSRVSMSITGLRPEQTYHVAVRAISSCDSTSALTTGEVKTTRQKFVTLSGCFIATAAYGTPMANELDPLRHLRDRHLLTNPLGRAFVAGYYALSPALAHVIAGDEHLRRGARALVAPLVELGRALEPIPPARP